MGGKKLLCLAWRFETPNDLLSSLGGLVRHLGRIVQTLVAALLHTRSQVTFCSTIGAQLASDHHPWHAIVLHQFTHETLGRFRIPTALYKNI